MKKLDEKLRDFFSKDLRHKKSTKFFTNFFACVVRCVFSTRIWHERGVGQKSAGGGRPNDIINAIVLMMACYGDVVRCTRSRGEKG